MKNLLTLLLKNKNDLTDLTAVLEIKNCYKKSDQQKAKRRVFQATLQSFFRANYERRATQSNMQIR